MPFIFLFLFVVDLWVHLSFPFLYQQCGPSHSLSISFQFFMLIFVYLSFSFIPWYSLHFTSLLFIPILPSILNFSLFYINLFSLRHFFLFIHLFHLILSHPFSFLSGDKMQMIWLHFHLLRAFNFSPPFVHIQWRFVIPFLFQAEKERKRVRVRACVCVCTRGCPCEWVWVCACGCKPLIFLPIQCKGWSSNKLSPFYPPQDCLDVRLCSMFSPKETRNKKLFLNLNNPFDVLFV